VRRFVLRVPYRLDTVNHRLIHAGPCHLTHGFRYPTKGYTCLESGCSHYLPPSTISAVLPNPLLRTPCQYPARAVIRKT